MKEISPGISLEGMMLTLKLQYFGHLMQRVYSLEKALMLGGRQIKNPRGTVVRLRCGVLKLTHPEVDVSQVYAPGPPNAHSATAMFSRLQITAVTATPSLRSVGR